MRTARCPVSAAVVNRERSESDLRQQLQPTQSNTGASEHRRRSGRLQADNGLSVSRGLVGVQGVYRKTDSRQLSNGANGLADRTDPSDPG